MTLDLTTLTDDDLLAATSKSLDRAPSHGVLNGVP